MVSVWALFVSELQKYLIAIILKTQTESSPSLSQYNWFDVSNVPLLSLINYITWAKLIHYRFRKLSNIFISFIRIIVTTWGYTHDKVGVCWHCEMENLHFWVIFIWLRSCHDVMMSWCHCLLGHQNSHRMSEMSDHDKKPVVLSVDLARPCQLWIKGHILII